MFSWHIEQAKLEAASIEAGFPLRDRPSKIVKILKSAGTDIEKSEKKARTIGSGALAFLTAASGSTKAPLYVKSQLILETLEYTQSSLRTGLVGAAAFGIWNKVAATFYDNGMRHYPTAISTAKEEFPNLTNTVSTSLPGLNSAPVENIRSPRTSLAKRLGSRVSLHLRRGAIVEGLGVAPYIFSAHAQQKSPVEVSRLATSASADGGIVAGTIACGLAEVMLRIGDSNAQLAETIDNTVSDPRVFIGAAAVLMASEFASNRRRNRRSEALAPA